MDDVGGLRGSLGRRRRGEGEGGEDGESEQNGEARAPDPRHGARSRLVNAAEGVGLVWDNKTSVGPGDVWTLDWPCWVCFPNFSLLLAVRPAEFGLWSGHLFYILLSFTASLSLVECLGGRFCGCTWTRLNARYIHVLGKGIITLITRKQEQLYRSTYLKLLRDAPKHFDRTVFSCSLWEIIRIDARCGLQ